MPQNNIVKNARKFNEFVIGSQFYHYEIEITHFIQEIKGWGTFWQKFLLILGQ
jgi:nicotinamidase-related amidase